MARAAGRKNYRLRKDNFEYVMALLQIADLQRAAGDMPQFAATVNEIRLAIDGFEGGKDPVGLRASIARVQAQAGLVEDALSTARSIPDPTARNKGYDYVVQSLVASGRWRDALAVVKQEYKNNDGWAEAEVMTHLVETGRREWVIEALPALAAKNEPSMLARLEIKAENFVAARAQAQRISDLDQRLQMIETIGDELVRRSSWDELVTTARLIPPEAGKLTDKFWRAIHFKIAAEWLTTGGAPDEALPLLQHLAADDRQEMLEDIASEHALNGNYRRATELLRSLDTEWRANVLPEIAFAKVHSGDEKLDRAMASLEDDYSRLEALKLLGELLPEENRDVARAALRLAVDLTARADVDDRNVDFWLYATMQARRGFFDDAHTTALRIRTIEELLGAYEEIGIGQARLGHIDEARKSFEIAESQARKYGFTGDAHARLAGAMADAGLLPEAFAHVQAMSSRDRDDYLNQGELERVIDAHIKAGQLPRAFEIATLLSEHDSGNPHYFLLIAKALAP